MSDFFTRQAERALGVAHTIEPRMVSRFADAAFAEGEPGFQEVHAEVERGRETARTAHVAAPDRALSPRAAASPSSSAPRTAGPSSAASSGAPVAAASDVRNAALPVADGDRSAHAPEPVSSPAGTSPGAPVLRRLVDTGGVYAITGEAIAGISDSGRSVDGGAAIPSAPSVADSGRVAAASSAVPPGSAAADRGRSADAAASGSPAADRGRTADAGDAPASGSSVGDSTGLALSTGGGDPDALLLDPASACDAQASAWARGDISREGSIEEHDATALHPIVSRGEVTAGEGGFAQRDALAPHRGETDRASVDEQRGGGQRLEAPGGDAGLLFHTDRDPESFTRGVSGGRSTLDSSAERFVSGGNDVLAADASGAPHGQAESAAATDFGSRAAAGGRDASAESMSAQAGDMMGSEARATASAGASTSATAAESIPRASAGNESAPATHRSVSAVDRSTSAAHGSTSAQHESTSAARGSTSVERGSTFVERGMIQASGATGADATASAVNARTGGSTAADPSSTELLIPAELGPAHTAGRTGAAMDSDSTFGGGGTADRSGELADTGAAMDADATASAADARISGSRAANPSSTGLLMPAEHASQSGYTRGPEGSAAASAMGPRGGDAAAGSRAVASPRAGAASGAWETVPEQADASAATGAASATGQTIAAHDASPAQRAGAAASPTGAGQDAVAIRRASADPRRDASEPVDSGLLFPPQQRTATAGAEQGARNGGQAASAGSTGTAADGSAWGRPSPIVAEHGADRAAVVAERAAEQAATAERAAARKVVAAERAAGGVAEAATERAAGRVAAAEPAADRTIVAAERAAGHVSAAERIAGQTVSAAERIAGQTVAAAERAGDRTEAATLFARNQSATDAGRSASGTAAERGTGRAGEAAMLFPPSRSAPRGPAAPAVNPAAEPERPVVKVSIGRIEVRPAPAPAPEPVHQPAAPGWRAPVLSLDEYLNKGAGQ